MLKPIVSMNQMAMNESIATTCCYTWNGNVTGSASVLHGGKLDVSYSYRYFYPETYTGDKNFVGAEFEISKGWLSNGLPVVPNWETKGIATQAGGMPYKCGGEWYDFFSEKPEAITKDNGLALTDYGKEHWLLKNPATFYNNVVAGTNITHTGATSAHYKWTSGNSWLSDHDAVQYSS